MLRTDRLASAARDHGKSLITAGADRLTSAVHGRKKSLLYVGVALAMAGAGSASAATVAGSASAPLSATPHTAAAAHPSARHSAAGHRARHAARHRAAHRRAFSWQQVSNRLNRETNPVAAAHHQVPFADRLTPVGTSGAQNWMPVNGAQVANATTIVRQALDKKMGVRSAVIAVATAMQESRLVNVNYGTGNSLGLFQQQWNMGWGTPAQIMNPRYSADAFLGALRQYQLSDPGWAAQPLWQAAQGVQRSAFPYAYAQWEAQAAHLVKRIATRML
jgi:hypothetical protein